MNKKQYTVELLVNGRPVKEYSHNSHTYVEGKDGSTYSIKIKNNSHKRIKAVITVDGFSILSDNKEDLNTGYVIDARESFVVKGFRTSEDTEAEFKFTSKGKSRAQKVLGYAKNCGVIGVRVYPEKEIFLDLLNEQYRKNDQIKTPWVPKNPYPSYPTHPPMYESFWCYDSNSSVTYSASSLSNQLDSINCSKLSNTTPNFNIGTEMGEDVVSKVKTVSFESDGLDSEFEIFYSTRKSLEDIGISFKKEKQVAMPKAFDGWCKRPK